MVRNLRPFAYGIVAAALLAVFFATPASWGSSANSALAQTIPSPTPTERPVTPTEPAPVVTVPASTPAPGATGFVPGATTVAPAGTSSAPTGACAGLISLTLVSDRTAVAPGMTVVFTATLTNTSRQPLRQIVLEDQLSTGLEPGRVISGTASWQGRILRATAPTLAAGSRLVAVYSATVGTQPASVLTARASATTAGCPAKTAAVTLALPPSELPRTGGRLD